MGMRVICLLVGFCFGSIPSGYLIAKSKGVDLRTKGSGNVGSTNVLRNMGRAYGALTLLMDMLKGIVPVIIMCTVFGPEKASRYIVTLYTGLGAVLGHDFSPFLHFRGGKGIATSGGVVLISDPVIFLVDFVLIFGTAALTGYVSLGSILAAIAYLLFNIYIVVTHRTPGWNFFHQSFRASEAMEVLIIACIFTALALVKHRSNIRRLIDGCENKVSFSGREP